MNVVGEYHARTNRTAQRWMLDKILSSMRNRKTGRVDFNLYPKAVGETNSLLQHSGALKRAVSYNELTRP